MCKYISASVISVTLRRRQTFGIRQVPIIPITPNAMISLGYSKTFKFLDTN